MTGSHRSVSNAEVLVYDMERRRPACVLLAAAMGGNPDFAMEWPSDQWIVNGVEGLRRYGPLTRAEVRKIAAMDAECGS